jgi:hypothetical protein
MFVAVGDVAKTLSETLLNLSSRCSACGQSQKAHTVVASTDNGHSSERSPTFAFSEVRAFGFVQLVQSDSGVASGLKSPATLDIADGRWSQPDQRTDLGQS